MAASTAGHRSSWMYEFGHHRLMGPGHHRKPDCEGDCECYSASVDLSAAELLTAELLVARCSLLSSSLRMLCNDLRYGGHILFG